MSCLQSTGKTLVMPCDNQLTTAHLGPDHCAYVVFFILWQMQTSWIRVPTNPSIFYHPSTGLYRGLQVAKAEV